MSGTPQKMLEHLLETRLGGQAGPNDPFLDDFLLTHIVFMPTPILIDELASTYHADTEVDMRTASEEDQEYFMTCKRRVVQFIQRWVLAVRHAVFDDPLAVEFIEVSVENMESHTSLGGHHRRYVIKIFIHRYKQRSLVDNHQTEMIAF